MFIKQFRWIVLAVAVALLLGVLSSYSAQDEIYFTAVNDELKDLNDATMPVLYKDKFYMPITIFKDQSLGVFYSYNKDIYKLTFYNKNNTIIFDMRMDLAYDTLQSYNEVVIPKNDTLYVPIEFICSMFNLDFTHINAAPVTILRVVSNSELDSVTFRVRNIDKMRDEYYSYTGNTPSPSGVQVSPGKTPSPTPSQVPRSEDVYLTFDCDAEDQLPAILDALDARRMKATFFLTGDVIAGSRDLVARMIGSGHAVGILGESDSESEALTGQVTAANEELDSAVLVKTRLFRFSLGSSSKKVTADMIGAMTDAGYVYWDWTIDASKYASSTPETYAEKTETTLGKAEETSVIRFDASDTTAGALPRILRYLRDNGYTPHVVSPGEEPVQFGG